MNTKIKLAGTLLIILIVVAIAGDMAAQCPMCRMSAESNLQNGGSAGKGLNNGILYMLAMPYIIIGTIGYVWWRNNKRRKEEMEDGISAGKAMLN